MSRVSRLLFRSLAALFGLCALLVVLVSWRVATLPATSVDISEYVQCVLDFFEPKLTAEMGKSLLVWDNRKQALSLDFENMVLRGPDKQEVVHIDKLWIKQKLWWILRGRFVPEEVTADRIDVALVRDEEGRISTGLNHDRSAQKKKVIAAVDFLFLQAIADELGNPVLHHKVDIKDVNIKITDERDHKDWSVKIPLTSLEHQGRSSKGSLHADLYEGEKSSSLQLLYGFDFERKLHNVKLAFQDVKLSAFAAQKFDLDVLKIADFPVSGQASFATDREMNIASAQIKLQGGAGFLNYKEWWGKPLPVQTVSLEASYDQSKNALHAPELRADFGGPVLTLSLEAKTPAPKDLIWLTNKMNSDAFRLHIALDNVPMARYGEIWPKVIIPDARGWVAANLRKGTYTHADVTLEGKAKWDDLENLELTSGSGNITAKGGDVHYLDDMPDVQDVDAQANFDLEHMDVKILKGHIGNITVNPFSLLIDRFQQDIQTITIPVQLQGPVQEVLTVLDSKPLGYATEIGLTPSDSGGKVSGLLTLSMPLLDDLRLDDVGVTAKAKIQSFVSQKLIPGIVISDGAMDLDLTKEGFNLKGSAALNMVPSQIVWQSFFSSKKDRPLHDGTITSTLEGSKWRLFYGLDSLAKIDGTTPVTIRYKNIKKGLSEVSGKVHLKDAAVKLKAIGWDKPLGQVADVDFTLSIPHAGNMKFTSLQVTGPSLKAKGTAELDGATGQLVAIQFNPFILGRSNAKISYIKPADVTQPLSITVTGQSFDRQGFEDDDEPDGDADDAFTADQGAKEETQRPKKYALDLQKFYTSETGFMTHVKLSGARDSIGWKDFSLIGLAQGNTPVSISLFTNKDSAMKLKMASDDFGAALKGLGLSDGVRGGKIEVWGQSAKDDPRAIEGTIKIGSFVVSDLPVLARLLSAVSPFGFVDMITGDANFDHLRSDYRLSGDDLFFRDLRAAGSVVGINMNGKINIETGAADMEGKLVPFSFVNSIIGSIPLLGDVITGGKGGGVIAAAFSIKENMSDPKISVNPVSLLTPGFLRNIFFPDKDIEGEAKKEKEKKEASEKAKGKKN